jgi:hypothetical protein
MQDKRTGSVPATQTKRVERAILALLLAEDHPWRLGELQKRLAHPMALLRICAARLDADGLIEHDGETLRVSRAAIRADELTLHTLRSWKP